MEVTKQVAIRWAQSVLPGRRILKIEPYFDYDVLNLQDFTSDMCFGKSDVLYIGNLTFNGMFNFWDTYANFTNAYAIAAKKITLCAGEFAESASGWDAGTFNMRSNPPGSAQGQTLPVMIWQIDNYHSYQFVGWKVTFVSAGPYPIAVSLGGSAVPTADNRLTDVSYQNNGYMPILSMDVKSFAVRSAYAHNWAFSIRLPKHMASFGANFTLTNGTLVSATVDGSYWIAIIEGSITSGAVTIQDIS